MIRPREFSTKEMVRALPKEVRAQFLALDPAERKLLVQGTDQEREQYGWLPDGAAKRYAKLGERERKEEAKLGRCARRFERPAPAAVAQVRSAVAPSRDLVEASGRVAASMRDIFELQREGVERVQSMATNYLQTGADEGETIDRVSQVLIDELPLPAAEAPPSRMEVMFGAGNVVRG